MAKLRNKKYRPRDIKVPMMGNSRNNLALELRLAVMTLVEAPTPEAFNQLSRMLASLALAGARIEVFRLVVIGMSKALQAVADRHIRVGKVGVSAGEAEALQQGVAELDALLGQLCMRDFWVAVAQVTVQCDVLESAQEITEE